MSGFFEKLLEEAQIETKQLPRAIEFHKRHGTEGVYEFYLNISEEDIVLNNIHGENVISQEQLDGSVKIEFLEPQRAVTPGQYAVLYVESDVFGKRRCLGGAVIESVIK